MKHVLSNLKRINLSSQLAYSKKHNSYVFIDDYGSRRVLLPIKNVLKNMNNSVVTYYPKKLILELQSVYSILDSLTHNTQMPDINVDTVMSELVEAVSYNPHTDYQGFDEFIWMLSNDLNSALVPKVKKQLDYELRAAANYLLESLLLHRLYEDNKFNYNYERRNNGYGAILVRQTHGLIE